jgi:2'-5' RNA ligase
MIRLFVAIELPGELRRRIAAMAGGVPSARWVSEDNLHLTLRFIGEIGEERIEDIAGGLAAVRGAPFPMTLAGVGHFETRRRVRTLWVGVSPSPALDALQARIETALVRAGLPPEGRKFSAHITLARLKGVTTAKVMSWLEANAGFAAAPFTVSAFTLLSSFLGHGGAVYRTVQEYPLDADAAAPATASPGPADPFPSGTRG